MLNNQQIVAPSKNSSINDFPNLIPINFNKMSRATSFRPFQFSPARNHLANSTSAHHIPTLQQSDPPHSGPTIISVSSQELARLLIEYQWRQQTEFPIVKITKHSVLSSTSENIKLSIVTEDINIIFAELDSLPLFKTIYLLKESLIGFQRLFSKYGPFLPTPSMIGINKNHKCKVWINEDFSRNEVLNLPLSQNCFLKAVTKMFHERTLKLKSSEFFFQGLQKQVDFHSTFRYLERFVRQNRVMVPSSFRPSQKEVKKESAGLGENFSHFQVPCKMFRGTVSYAVDPAKILPNKKQLLLVSEQTIGKQGNQKPMKESAETTTELFRSDHKERDLIHKQQYLHNLGTPLSNPPRITSSLGQNNNFFTTPKKLPGSRRPTLFASSNAEERSDIHACQAASSKNSATPKSIKLMSNQNSREFEFGAFLQQNNWEAKFGGLFTGSSHELKQSYQNGEEVGWSPLHRNNRELSLLGQFGKELLRSQMKDPFSHI